MQQTFEFINTLTLLDPNATLFAAKHYVNCLTKNCMQLGETPAASLRHNDIAVIQQ